MIKHTSIPMSAAPLGAAVLARGKPVSQADALAVFLKEERKAYDHEYTDFIVYVREIRGHDDYIKRVATAEGYTFEHVDIGGRIERILFYAP